MLGVVENAELLKAMESKRGFVEMPAVSHSAPAASPRHSSLSWPGWRGPNRDAIVADLPKELPASLKFLWTTPLAGAGLAGVVATENEVVVADREPLNQNDVFCCLDAATGQERWKLEYPAPGKLDYGSSPRAAPLIYDGKVYLLGAFGDLHCVNLADGAIVWKKNLVREYKSKLPTWGYCASPLLVDGRLIVNPGAAAASIVALDAATGKEQWRCDGPPAAYASFIVGRFGGVRQIVGYDSVSLGGWDIATGDRLWAMIPRQKGDFNVPTPIAVDGKLLVASENNGTRLYDFDEGGVIRQKPLAENADFAPDSSTPVVLDGKVFGCHGELVCLDAANLKTLWTSDDKAFKDYASFIAGSGRVLVATVRGELILLRAGGARCELISRFQVFDEGDMLAYPALVGNHLYLRGSNSVRCLVLE